MLISIGLALAYLGFDYALLPTDKKVEEKKFRFTSCSVKIV